MRRKFSIQSVDRVCAIYITESCLKTLIWPQNIFHNKLGHYYAKSTYAFTWISVRTSFFCAALSNRSVLRRALDMVDWCTFTPFSGDPWPLTSLLWDLFADISVCTFFQTLFSSLFHSFPAGYTLYNDLQTLFFISYCGGYFNNSQIEVKCKATVPSLRQFFIYMKGVLL